MRTCGSGSNVVHWTPAPVVCRYCPLTPDEAPAVRVPVSVLLFNVNAVIVVTVAPEPIVVLPRVGAE